MQGPVTLNENRHSCPWRDLSENILQIDPIDKISSLDVKHSTLHSTLPLLNVVVTDVLKHFWGLGSIYFWGIDKNLSIYFLNVFMRKDITSNEFRVRGGLGGTFSFIISFLYFKLTSPWFNVENDVISTFTKTRSDSITNHNE